MKRIAKKITLICLGVFVAAVSHAQAMGSLQVVGQAGRFQLFQKVKAIRCTEGQRGVCDAPIYFELNKAQTVPAGSYLVGFENSMHPGVVRVGSGQAVSLTLEKIPVPSRIRGEKIRAYRDFSAVIEQKKIYLEMYLMKRHFFRLSADNFGDYYLTSAWERDAVQRFTYEACAKLSEYGEVAPSATAVCDAWTNAREALDLRELFDFSNDGTFTEMWVSLPGDVIPTKHFRYLVSVPMTKQDFISVFPGAYKFQAEGSSVDAVAVRSRSETQVASQFNFSLNPLVSSNSLLDRGCSSAGTWKTDIRSFCTSDLQEGCDRSTAQTCQPMP